MKRKEFKLLLEDMQELHRRCEKLQEVGFDQFENKYAIAPLAEKFFDIILKQNYNAFGVDWIGWFVYENDFGDKKMGAWNDDKALICQTVDGLYDYCKQYRKK
jgi:hypothetical protein